MENKLLSFDPASLPYCVCDVVVIGSGIAGLSAALELSKDYEVILLTKGDIRETATWLAQGGLAATVSKKDSPLYHLKDTVMAGDDLCNIAAVETLVHQGPQYVNDLIKLGTRFDISGARFSLGREGGHSRRRILHFKDATGSEIQDSLVRASQMFASIEVREHNFAVDLLRYRSQTLGVLTLDLKAKKLSAVLASHVVIASGGAGQLYSVTTNPALATGDGIAMAYRAGAELMDMEFVQFHPTVFFKDGRAIYLITEALRGEGAYLVDEEGNRLMDTVHPLKELAPRDVVSRTIFTEMKKTGGKRVFLDARHIGARRLHARFPAITEFLKKHGLDLAKDLIPIAPAAHYFIGGIRTNLDGRSSIPGVYVCGEAAATGVHGANRLASNSLLEGLVFARRIAEDIKGVLRMQITEETRAEIVRLFKLLPASASRSRSRSEGSEIASMRAEIGRIMWENVSVFRREKGLVRASQMLSAMDRVQRVELPDQALMELRNLHLVAKLVVASAYARKESRGVHFRADHPKKNDRKWRLHLSVKRGVLFTEAKKLGSLNKLLGEKK